MINELSYKNIDELKPYENNPRNNANAIKSVAESIKEFGFKVPIVIDKDNVIVAGHTRYQASIELGLKSVPCIVADDLTEEQIKAFRLVDNKTGELSGWDFVKLEEELASVEGIDMAIFGFDVAEDIDIDDFFKESEAPVEKKSKMIQCPHCGEYFEA